MKEMLTHLAQTDLFSGLQPNEIEPLLLQLKGKFIHYKPGEIIIEEGCQVEDLGLLLSGHAHAVKWDSSGKVVIISLLEQGSEIGAILAASNGYRSPVTVQAKDSVSVLFIPFDLIIKPNQVCYPYQEQLLRNAIHIVAKKGLSLHERIRCLLQPSIRDKVMTYLQQVSTEQTGTFTIAMNRNELAEYLNVERSALSRELSKMKHDGLIHYHKNSFQLF